MNPTRLSNFKASDFSAMDLASRIRRSFFRGNRKTQENPNPRNGSKIQQSIEKDKVNDVLLGVTEELIEHVSSFTIDTFKNFPLQDEESTVNSFEEQSDAMNSSARVRKDLSDWQERHAVLVLSKSKVFEIQDSVLQELSLLRFKLCPRLLKEQQFWGIYFKLVRDLVAEYELRSIQEAEIKGMAIEDGKSSKTEAVYEIEMAETSEGMMSFRHPTT